MAEKYNVHQIVCSIQGEGAHFGIQTAFLRFSGCNLSCAFCDTKDHVKGRDMTLGEIMAAIKDMDAPWVHLCGGEPTLQADTDLVTALHQAGMLVSMETNGTNPVAVDVDYLVVSPKVTTAVLQRNFAGRHVDEVKYVLKAGQLPPDPIPIQADHYILSPMFDDMAVNPDALRWVLALVYANPRKFRFSIQVHKWVGVI